MLNYCKRCKEIHSSEDICPFYQKQLREHPELLTEAANFSTVAAQYHLISSQTLDTVAKGINKISGSQLGYEGTQQYMRDVQVFRQLKVDAYCKSGAFENARNARSYIENASNGQRDTLIKKLNGTGQ
ncbi:hypothetical protein [Paenibacillus sp.]|uniref:hypothetical protein n=1 Tax=Paenibacillus sp. TaxID=58172 RepID=UPI0028AF2E98|nr:hypothetical protein [Paenibacillus sp.]